MIQQAQDVARATLAACATFQGLVGTDPLSMVDEATQALANIYHDALPPPISGRPEHTRAELTALRPCAIVYTEDNQGYVVHRNAAGMQDCWNAGGSIHIVLFRNVPAADATDNSKVDTDFRTIIGGIISDMIGMSETAPYLAAQKFTVSGPTRTPIKELSDIGDAQAAEITVEWGLTE